MRCSLLDKHRTLQRGPARLQGLGEVADALDDEEGGGGVQAGADLI